MRHKIIIAAIVVLMLAGCAGKQVDLMSMDQQTTESLKQFASDKLELWPFWSGIITEALRERADEIPVNVWTAIGMLDMLAAKPVNDYGLGTALALQVKMNLYIVNEALERFAPGLLSVILGML